MSHVSEVSPSGSASEQNTGVDFQAIAHTDRFRALRSRHRQVVFPLTLVFFAWYLLYVLLADYAHDFMATKVLGSITVGILFGLLQIVSTFIITMVYVRYANETLDPLASAIRIEAEGAATPSGARVDRGIIR